VNKGFIGKLSSLFGVVLLLELLNACRCPKTATFSVNLQTIEFQLSDTTLTELRNLDAIAFEDYRIKCVLHADIRKIIAMELPSLLTQTAYAHKCPENKFVVNKAIHDIKVVPSEAIWGYEAGDTIQQVDDYFACYQRIHNLNGPLPDFQQMRFPLSQLNFQQEPGPRTTFLIEMKQKPSDSLASMSFTFLFTLTDSSVVALPTKSIVIF
jgi:hypothetical protein